MSVLKAILFILTVVCSNETICCSLLNRQVKNEILKEDSNELNTRFFKGKLEIQSRLIFMVSKDYRKDVNSFDLGLNYNLKPEALMTPYLGLALSSERIVNQGYETLSNYNGGIEDNRDVNIHQFSLDFNIGGKLNLPILNNSAAIKIGGIFQPILFSKKSYRKACYPVIMNNEFCQRQTENYSIFGEKEYMEQPFLNFWITADVVLMKNRFGLNMGYARMLNDYQNIIDGHRFKGVQRVSIGLIYMLK